MKVKNIAFSGFAAVILASVCGNAMAVSLASKTYVDEGLATKANLIDLEALQTTVGQKATQESLEVVATQVNTNTTDIANLKSGKQDSLVAGTNISIVDNTISATGLVTTEKLVEIQTVLQDAIDEKQAAGEYAQASELETLKTTVENLQTGNVDKTVVENLQTSVETIAADYAKKSELTAAEERLDAAIKAIVIPTIPTLVSAFENDAGYITSAALTEYAKTADVESALGAKEDSANKLTTATADEIEAMSSDDKATKFPSVAVAQTIANAAVTKVNEVAGDLSTLQTQVGTNTADIAEIKAAGYQTADDVSGAIETATADLATKSEVEAVSTVANAAAVKADVDAALENIYTKTEVDAAIEAIEEYDDTALAARVTANEGAIATNTTGIADNKSAIESLQNAGFVAGTKTAGSYLVNFDAEGNASYAAVEILDATGAPIDLTTGAVKQCF